MRIEDVMRGSSVLAEIEIQHQQVLISTEVLFGMNDGVLVNRIMVGDGDLIWKRPCKVTIHNKRDERTYIFQAATIEPIETQYGRVHKIVSSSEGEQKEMRVAERMEVIRLGSVFSHGITYKAIIYDISATGIAVILDGNVHMKVGDNCTIRFILGDSKEVLRAFEFEAEVVRFFDVKGRVAVGCRVRNMPSGVLDALNQIEAEKVLQAALSEAAEDVVLDVDVDTAKYSNILKE